jgi:hypothetical protein
MSKSQTQNAPLKGVKVFVDDVFDWLQTAPECAVIIYKVAFNEDKYPGLQDFYVATLDDGNLQVAWGIGIAPEDALEVAAREWDYLYSDSPVRVNNPFREILQANKEEEETND